MNRMCLLMGGVLAGLTFHVFAQDAAVSRRRDETITKADALFGQRYPAPTKVSPRFYDKQTETGAPDEIIYRHGPSYVIELIFAADGTIARVALLPEALLYTDDWSKVPDNLEVSRSEMQWLVASANTLRSFGKARHVEKAADDCFQSGRNLYCTDTYALAIVSHYHIQRPDEKHWKKVAQKDVLVLYRRLVIGIVEDAKMKGSQRLLKVGGQWYHGEKPGVEIFSEAQIGSTVRLISFGCTSNQNACIAVSEQSKPGATSR